jgi:hypothetical protein
MPTKPTKPTKRTPTVVKVTLGIVFGAILGSTFVALYNRTQCSTAAEALAGCHYLKPAAGLLGGGLIGALVGGVGAMLTRTSAPDETE